MSSDFTDESAGVFLIRHASSNIGYGDTDSAVVIATNEDDARAVMFEKSGSREYQWFHPTEVTVTCITGVVYGEDGIERGIVLTHETPN